MEFELSINEDGRVSPLTETHESGSGPGVVNVNLRAIPLWRARILLGIRLPAEFTKLMQDLGITEPADGMLHVDVVDRLEMELQRRARIRAGMFG